MQKPKEMELRTLNKRHAFGIKSDVYGCIHWLDENTLTYPVGRNVVIHNVQSNAQKFFLTSEKTESITAIALSPNKKYIAIAESGDHPQIQIVDTNTRKRRRVLNVTDLGSDRFVAMQFSADGRHLATQGGAPHWNLLYWNWERSKPLAQVQVVRDQSIPQGRDFNYNVVSHISINPKDPLHIVVSGNGLFRFYRYVDGVLRPSSGGLGKAHTQNFTCHSWVTEDRIIVATDNGDLLLIADGEFRCPLPVAPSDNHSICAIMPTSKGFVCGGESSLIHIFEQTDDKEMYKKLRTLTIEPKNRDPLDDSARKCTIRNFALTHGEDMLAMATSTLQVYGLNFSVDWSKHDNPIFHTITQPFHAAPIVGLDTCIRKPLVATSSLDRTVRIWNTQEHTVEVIKTFPTEPGAISLHPSGLHILVVFSDKVRFMNLYGDSIQDFKSWTLRSVSDVKFSVGGQYFAVVHGNSIQLYNTYTCEQTFFGQLRGHSQKVRSIQWCSPDLRIPTDTRIVSCATDGSVIDWSVKDVHKGPEHLDRKYQYHSVVSDHEKILVVGTPAPSQAEAKWKVKLREIDITNMHGDAIQQDYEFTDLHIANLVLAPKHRLLFGGCTDGSIKLMTFPLQGGLMDPPILAHAGAVSKMALSYDESILFSVGADGSFFIFDVKEDGRTTKRETTYAEEILISKVDLDEKTNQEAQLRQQVEDLKLDMEYQEKRRSIQHDERVKELTDHFKEEAEKQNAQFLAVWNAKIEQERTFAEVKREKAEEHRGACESLEKEKARQLARLEEECKERRQTLAEQRESFAAQLRAREEEISRQRTEAKEKFQAALRQESEQVAKLQGAISRNDQTHKETRHQLERDTDDEIESIKAKYEDMLGKEREKFLHMKGENAIMKKNISVLEKEKENREGETNVLDLSQAKLKQTIRQLNAEIAQLHSEIDARDTTIGEKEKQIYELKKRNQDLEKHKFVLDHRIRSLKSQIEPRQMEIQKENERIKAKDADLEQFHRNNLALRINIGELDEQITAQRAQIKTLNNKLKDFETYKSRVKTDIGELAQLVQDPDSLKTGINKMYQDHVVARGGKRCAALEPDLRKEFDLQTESRSKMVESLKRKVQHDMDTHKTEVSKVMVENLGLIKEIHDLRREIRNLRNAAATQEGAATVTAPPQAHAQASAREQSAKEMDANRAEIQKLRGKIDELERQIQHRQQTRPASRDQPLPPIGTPTQ